MAEQSQHAPTLEATRRSIDASIRILFSGEDSLAVHLVVASALAVLHHLVRTNPREPLDHLLRSFLVPEGEPLFLRALGELAESAELRDSSSSALWNAPDERTDFDIAISCLYLRCLEGRSTIESQAFLWWFATMYPHVMKADRFFNASLPAQDFQWLRGAPRTKQLQFGDTILRLARRNKLTPQS